MGNKGNDLLLVGKTQVLGNEGQTCIIDYSKNLITARQRTHYHTKHLISEGPFGGQLF